MIVSQIVRVTTYAPGSAGESFAAKHFRPVFERQVDYDDHAQPFLNGADGVKEHNSAATLLAGTSPTRLDHRPL